MDQHIEIISQNMAKIQNIEIASKKKSLKNFKISWINYGSTGDISNLIIEMLIIEWNLKIYIVKTKVHVHFNIKLHLLSQRRYGFKLTSI